MCRFRAHELFKLLLEYSWQAVTRCHGDTLVIGTRESGHCKIALCLSRKGAPARGTPSTFISSRDNRASDDPVISGSMNPRCISPHHLSRRMAAASEALHAHCWTRYSVPPCISQHALPSSSIFLLEGSAELPIRRPNEPHQIIHLPPCFVLNDLPSTLAVLVLHLATSRLTCVFR